MSLVDQIISVESAGNPNAKNPRSSALGAGQFIESTWLNMLSKYRPELTTGRSRDEILALRTDPTLSKQMTEALALENADALTKAGFQATPGNTYLAHFAGPKGALGVLGANPTTPVADILGPSAVRANPFLANMTAADLAAWANNKMGVTPEAAAPQPANVPAPMAAPMASPFALASPEAQPQRPNPMATVNYFAQFDQPPPNPPEQPTILSRHSRFSGPLKGAFSFGKR